MFPWKSTINFNKDNKRSVYLQIADSIISEILNGRIPKSYKMPGTRALAEELSLNRKTISLAYDELLAQGWLEIIPSKGTFVKKALPLVNSKPLPKSVQTKESHFVQSIKPLPFQANQELIKPANSIDDGIPDYRLAPIDLLLKTARSISKGHIGRNVMLNASSYGDPTLRSTLCQYLSTTRALNGEIDNILVTRGSQMAIYLLFSVLLRKGDKVIVGKLNYKYADQIVEHLGANLMRVPLNNEGLDIDEIEKICSKEKIRGIYISPHHHYPTTVTMPAENRMKLLELATKHNFVIIEDDYDYDYHYAGSPILPLASLDSTGSVVYIGSFSKILVPSIRMGYVFAHPTIINEITKLRRMIDKQGDPIMERSLAELIQENEVQRHLKKAVRAYKQRRDVFCQTLTTELGDIVNFNIPDGGMAIWATFTNGIVIRELVDKAEKNNLYLNIDPERTPHSCRFGFASMSESELTTNTDLLIKTIKAYFNS